MFGPTASLLFVLFTVGGSAPMSSTSNEDQPMCSNNQTLSITNQFLLPHHELANYSNLVGVTMNRLRHRDLTDLYVYSLEAKQLLEFLKAQMVCLCCNIIY